MKMGRTPRAAVTPRAAAQQLENSKHVGRAALTRGPLGVIIALFGLAECGLGLATGLQTLPATSMFLSVMMVLLACVTLLGFLYAWLYRPAGILYSPRDFDDQNLWLRAVGVQDLAPSKTLALERISPSAESASGTVVPDPAVLEIAVIELQRGSINSTGIMVLAGNLAEATGWDYLLVDIGDGDHWLLSRLFGFITMYMTQHPLPCLVFVHGGERGQRLVGIADPARLCGTLSRLYPWFNSTLAKIMVARNMPVFGTASVDSYSAISLLTDFISRLQDHEKSHLDDAQWSQLSPGAWEHTSWLREEMLREEHGPVMLDLGQSRRDCHIN
jgi:hypothetical protein